jgi:hypothetical protein
MDLGDLNEKQTTHVYRPQIDKFPYPHILQMLAELIVARAVCAEQEEKYKIKIKQDFNVRNAF